MAAAGAARGSSRCSCWPRRCSCAVAGYAACRCVAPELAELERALRVSGRPAAPATTLADLERRLGASADARGYLRAVAAQRFAASGAPPTERERRAMRRELASGLGRIGRVRAWWAMPPRPFAARAQAR